jgi:hypothetical protein
MQTDDDVNSKFSYRTKNLAENCGAVTKLYNLNKQMSRLTHLTKKTLNTLSGTI